MQGYDNGITEKSSFDDFQAKSVSAKLFADGVNVFYQVPNPPLINNENDINYHDIDDEEYSRFLRKVKNSSPVFSGSLKRSETSSMTLPVTWSTSSLDRRSDNQETSESKCSEDSILYGSPHIQGPIVLLDENFEPQVITEDYIAPPHEYTSSSMGSSMFYSTFIPDSALNTDEVGIVCNEFTKIETESTISDESIKPEYNKKYNNTWKSNVRLPSLLDYWEKKNKNEETNKFKKYASESNLFENPHPPENGLRNIIKEKNLTSCEESFPESDFSVQSGYEDHIYQKINYTNQSAREESGFFSYESKMCNSLRFNSEIKEISEEPSDYDDDLPDPTYADCFDSAYANASFITHSDSDNHVTIIAVDYKDTNNTNNNNIEQRPQQECQSTKFSSVRDLRKMFEISSGPEQNLLKIDHKIGPSDTVKTSLTTFCN